MSVEQARDLYIGKNGHRKHNCAEAVAHAFREKFDLSDAVLDQFRSCGGGRAPGGLCGSLHAAKVLFGRSHPEQVLVCERDFLARAGSDKCREIRALRKLSCVGCVETVAEHIDKLLT